LPECRPSFIFLFKKVRSGPTLLYDMQSLDVD
jgi:hypothetical protein